MSDEPVEEGVYMDEERAAQIISNPETEPAVRFEVMTSMVLSLMDSKYELYSRLRIHEARLAGLTRILNQETPGATEKVIEEARTFLRLSELAPMYFWRFAQGDSALSCVVSELDEREEIELEKQLEIARDEDDLEVGECANGECLCPKRCTLVQQCVATAVLATNNPS